MIKSSLKNSPLLKRVNQEDSFTKKITDKHQKPISILQKDLNPIYKVNMGESHLLNRYKKPINRKLEKTLMSSGTVSTLDGYWKDKYENFLGLKLPEIRIHKSHNAILKTNKHKAKAYVTGHDIYMGKDIKPIDSLEGQMTMAHEITHVLQQEHLDMSSSRKMVDPSVELEKKAKGVEGIVKFRRGIDESASDLIKKRELLPFNSYIYENLVKDKFSKVSGFIQRKDLFGNNIKANLLDADNSENIFINQYTRYKEYKEYLTRKEFKYLSEEAKSTGMTIEIRSMSKEAKVNRESGSLAKPMSIKQKTLGQDDIDYLISDNSELKKHKSKVAIYKPQDINKSDLSNKIFEKEIVAKKGESDKDKKERLKNIEKTVTKGLSNELREEYLNELKKKNPNSSEHILLKQLKEYEFSKQFQKDVNIKKENIKDKKEYYKQIRVKEILERKESRKKAFVKYQIDKEVLEYQKGEKKLQDLNYIKEKLFDKLKDKEKLKSIDDVKDSHFVKSNYMKIASLDLDSYKVDENGLVKSKKSGKTYTSDLDIHSITTTRGIKNRDRAFIKQDEETRKKGLLLIKRLIKKGDSHVEHFATKQSWYSKVVGDKVFTTKAQEYSDAKTRKDENGKIKKGAEALIFSEKDIRKVKLKANKARQKTNLVNDILKKYNITESGGKHNSSQLKLAQDDMLMKAQNHKDITKRHELMSKYYTLKSLSLNDKDKKAIEYKRRAKKFANYGKKSIRRVHLKANKTGQKTNLVNNILTKYNIVNNGGKKSIRRVHLEANKAGQKTNLVNNILTKYNIVNNGGKHNSSQVKLVQDDMLMKAQNHKDITEKYKVMSEYFTLKALSIDGRTKEYKRKAEKFANYTKRPPPRVQSSHSYNPDSPSGGDGSHSQSEGDDDYFSSEENTGNSSSKGYSRKGKSRRDFILNLTNRAKKYTSMGKKFYNKHKGGGNLKNLQDKYQKTKEFTTKLVTGKLEIGDVDDTLQTGTKFIESDKLKKFEKLVSNKKFEKFSKRLKGASKLTSKLKKGSDIKKLLSGEASASDAIGLAKDGTEFASKKFKKLAKFGKASKFLGFIQRIVGVFDSKILSNPLKLAQTAAGAIGDFIGSIAGKIGGKVIAGIIASATAGIGTLLYPVTSYFGGMLVEGGIGLLYDRYAKSPIVKKIHSFAKNSIDSIEENFPTIGHLINGRYLEFFKGMFSFIKPKAIYNFIDNFMGKNFPIVWKGTKLAGKALKKTGEFIGEKIFDGVQGLKKLGGSIWGVLKSFGSSLWGGTKKLASKGLKYAKQGAKWVGDKAGKAWSGVKSVGSSIWGGMKSFGSSLWGGTKKIASKGLKYAKQGAKWVGDKAGKAWSGVKSVGSSIWGGMKSFGSSLWGGAKSLASKGLNYAKQGAKWVGDKAGKAWSGVKSVGSSIWGGMKSFGSSLWGGSKKIASKGLKYAKQGTKWVGDKAGKAWSGVKSVGSSIWGGMKSFGSSLWGGAKSLASKGLNYAKQGAKWVGSKVSRARDSVVSGAKSAYRFGEDRVSQASSYILNKTKKMSNTISSGAKSAYNFGEKKLKQFGGTVSKTWDSVSNLFKFAEANRHQNQTLSKNRESSKGSKNSSSSGSTEEQLDELSMKIFRRLKQEVALEYVRSGKS